MMLSQWVYDEIKGDLKHFGLEGYGYDVYYVIETDDRGSFDSIINLEQWHSCMPICAE